MNSRTQRWMKRIATGLVTATLLLSVAQAQNLGQDMPLSYVLIDGEGWELLADGLQFTEGPTSDADGNVFFTDVRANRIYKIDLDGTVTPVVENSGGASGLMFGPDGRLYACQGAKERIVAFDKDWKATTIAEGIKGNDLVVGYKGDIYVTEPRNKQVWHITPQGEKSVVDTGIEVPNGIILWSDQGTLVVADTRGSNLWAFRIEPDGTLAYKQPYYDLRLVTGQNGSGADGMTVDAAGRLYVATFSGLQVFDPIGRLSGVIDKPQDKFLSNVTFGGPGLEWLYVTCSDKVYRRKTKSKGVLFFEAPAAQ